MTLILALRAGGRGRQKPEFKASLVSSRTAQRNPFLKIMMMKKMVMMKMMKMIMMKGQRSGRVILSSIHILCGNKECT